MKGAHKRSARGILEDHLKYLRRKSKNEDLQTEKESELDQSLDREGCYIELWYVCIYFFHKEVLCFAGKLCLSTA